MLLTAGMGAGHDRVAQEIRRRLAGRGIDTEILDVWDLLPCRLGWVITVFYKTIIGYAPWIYEGIYTIWLRPGERGRRRTSPLIRLAGRRLRRWMAANRPAAAVSTFHLCSQVLGDMRRRNMMAVPTASIVVDFAAHGLWVDPDVDVHFCLHDSQAQRVRSLGAPRVEAPGPVVSPAFSRPGITRAEARSHLGLDLGEPTVLVVAGSWGAGRIERTARAIAAGGRFHPVLVAGRNDKLRRQLEAAGCGRVLGWVDDMAMLMTASDVVVENAGGLMAMEAMALGIPVVSFDPIPGHGRENAARMEEAGVSRYARSQEGLLRIMDRLLDDEGYREHLTGTASAMFRSDVADRIADMVHRPEQMDTDPITDCKVSDQRRTTWAVVGRSVRLAKGRSRAAAQVVRKRALSG